MYDMVEPMLSSTLANGLILELGKISLSGGVGIACISVGPNAPLPLEFRLRGTFMEHVYDFHKPDLSSEFPTVDDPILVVSYNKALGYAYLG
ncbi:hypothetical protein BB559_002348 [Furculomyces boomerangus]|uniref:Hydroxymethylglutaryl-coenzyme A synthase C-terminal domain-containing protein n=2 Tax=Harpellales TaxID=61421 RepID=A0A2T9YW33_9FUNG|nr:hypothetical protein BB559_002348 [Furculomyces boomerangus]PWA02352.1 hypothetical protein BB558_001510 [Smittium angustum]